MRYSPSSHALTNPRSDCPVGTPPQDEFKWIRKMTLLAGIVASPTMPMPPFLYYPFFAALCVTFFKFRFHFYYFLRIAPFYFLLIYIDKNNTHLMDDDFLFLFIHHSADFCSFFFTSSSSSNQYALIRCFCFFWCSSSKYLCRRVCVLFWGCKYVWVCVFQLLFSFWSWSFQLPVAKEEDEWHEVRFPPFLIVDFLLNLTSLSIEILSHFPK